jgi:hypothetical protein
METNSRLTSAVLEEMAERVFVIIAKSYEVAVRKRELGTRICSTSCGTKQSKRKMAIWIE